MLLVRQRWAWGVGRGAEVACGLWDCFFYYLLIGRQRLQRWGLGRKSGSSQTWGECAPNAWASLGPSHISHALSWDLKATGWASSKLHRVQQSSLQLGVACDTGVVDEALQQRRPLWMVNGSEVIELYCAATA